MLTLSDIQRYEGVVGVKYVFGIDPGFGEWLKHNLVTIILTGM